MSCIACRLVLEPVLGSEKPPQRANRPEQVHADSGFGQIEHGGHVAGRVFLELAQNDHGALSVGKAIDSRKQLRPAFGVEQRGFG